jgi:hypothetical protein
MVHAVWDWGYLLLENGAIQIERPFEFLLIYWITAFIPIARGQNGTFVYCFVSENVY